MSVRKVVTESGQEKWEIRVHLNGRSSKRIRRRFDRKIDAVNFELDFMARSKEIKQSLVPVKNFEETTFIEEAKYWLSVASSEFSPGHLKKVKGILTELSPKIGNLCPNLVTSAKLNQLRTAWLAEEARPATINRKFEVVLAVLNFSVEQLRIPYNPVKGFTKLKEVREEMKFWYLEEARSFLDYANARYPEDSDRRWVYVVYLLALNTALRAGEIWGLKPMDVVENGEILFVRRQFDRVAKTLRPPKGKRSRRVPCSEDLRVELFRLVNKRSIRPDGLIFQGQEGNAVNHDSFADVFERDVKRWAGKRIRFHDLRHTATTLMIAIGVDLKTVQEICGHQSISTTMGYAHLVERSINSVARTFSVKPNGAVGKITSVNFG